MRQCKNARAVSFSGLCENALVPPVYRDVEARHKTPA
jgi:hypothetical protein